MFGKYMKTKIISGETCLRPNGLKQARKEGVGGEIMVYVW